MTSTPYTPWDAAGRPGAAPTTPTMPTMPLTPVRPSVGYSQGSVGGSSNASGVVGALHRTLGLFDPSARSTNGRAVSNAPFKYRTTSPSTHNASRKASSVAYIWNMETDDRLRFLYDPSEIAFSYNMKPLTPPDQQSAADQEAQLLMEGMSTGLDIIFDRTAEVANNDETSISGELHRFRDLGVLHDIYMLDQVIGATDGTLVHNNEVAVKISKNWSFVGWITSCSIRYTSFAPDMVPLRAFVSLGIQRLVGGRQVGEEPNLNIPYVDGAGPGPLPLPVLPAREPVSTGSRGGLLDRGRAAVGLGDRPTTAIETIRGPRP